MEAHRGRETLVRNMRSKADSESLLSESGRYLDLIYEHGGYKTEDTGRPENNNYRESLGVVCCLSPAVTM